MSIATKNIRNVAIIAHVDHGKTTLVDGMLQQAGGLDRRHDVERVMDSNDIEKERGITILGKATSIRYKGVKINIADTPGHADFGSEVERMMTMVDGVVLLVDAAEGPLPQTRFVLSKALDKGLACIVVVNKIDRQDARPDEVLDEVYDLFIDLGADEQQIEFPVLYTNARDGLATTSLDIEAVNLEPLFEEIIKSIPSAPGDSTAKLQALVTNTSYDNYLGRMALGRVVEGTLREGEIVSVIRHDKTHKVKLGQLYVFEGLESKRVPEAGAGELFSVAGIEDIGIGDTIGPELDPVQLPRVRVDEPTIAMFFSVNNGPFAGTEGKYVTSRHIGGRLQREARANVGLRVEETESADTFKVVGRGELALSILIENMRREGYELLVSMPEVVTKTDENGKLLEPMEKLFLDLPEEFVGTITQRLAERKGIMQGMKTLGSGRVRVEFRVPSRGLIGFRSMYLNDTRGQGIMSSLLEGWEPWYGEMRFRQNGAIVCGCRGTTTPYALMALQPRGTLFISPSLEVYDGMVIGENSRTMDIEVNPTKEKKLTNVRSSGRDDAVALTPPRKMSLEEAIQWIDQDELVEITPVSVRIRKRFLTTHERERARKSLKKAATA